MFRSRPLAGFACAVLAALCFSGNTIAARLAYGEGTNPLTYVSFRSLLACVFVVAVIALTRGTVALPPRQRLHALALGTMLGFYSFCLLSSIEYIPVALSTVIFYTFPLLVSAYMWTTGRERPTALSAAALVVAAAGIVLALDIGGGAVDIVGVAFAATAAFGVGSLVVLNSRLVGSGDSRPVTAHMMASAAAVCFAATFLFDDFALPSGASGWAQFAIGTSFYAIAAIAWFGAISFIGPVPASLTMNLDPVATVLLGFLILGQDLARWQVVGIVLVIGAILAARLDAVRRQNTFKTRNAQ